MHRVRIRQHDSSLANLGPLKQPVLLSFKLAGLTTLLLILGTSIEWWLARSRA